MGRRRRAGLIRRLIAFAVLAVATLYGFFALGLLYVRFYPPPTTAVQIERRIEAFTSGQEHRFSGRWTPLDEIPVRLQRAVIAAEDGAFYTHDGVDWEELTIAVDDWRRRGKSLRGASTLTQQLVKNLFLTTSRSPLRKLVEWTLAPLAELILSKQRILELYLNVIEWGPGVWGAAAASEYHYNASLDSLSRRRAARLAACIPAPRSRKAAEMDQYSAVILERMAARGW